MKLSHPIVKYISPLYLAVKSCSRKVKCGCIANTVCGIAGVAMMLLTVMATRDIVNAACDGHNDRVAALGMMFCIFLLSRLFATRLGQWIEAWCVTQNSNAVRSRLFLRIINGSFSAEDEPHSAEVVSSLTSDIAAVSSAVCSVLPAVVVSGVCLVGAFAYFFSMAPALALAITVLMPIVIVLGKLPLKKTRWLTQEIREAETSVSKTLQDDVSHRILLQTLGYSIRAHEDFNRRQSHFYRLTLRRNNLSILSGGAVSFGFMAGYAVMFLYCAYGLMKGDVSFATMTALLQLTSMVQQPVVSLSQKITPLVKATVSAERIQRIYDSYTTSLVEDTAKGVSTEEIKFEHVWHRYGIRGDYVLQDFCETIPMGKVTTILGETGAGKTTLFRLLLGLCLPEEGKVKTPFDTSEYADIVYVPQGNTLISGTIRGNLLMGKPDASDNEISLAMHLASADFVKHLPGGLTAACGEYGHGLSEGQAQRIAIARGILRLMAVREKMPQNILFLMDEPSSSLDIETERILFERLMPYLKGTTVVIITHKGIPGKYSDKTIRL